MVRNDTQLSVDVDIAAQYEFDLSALQDANRLEVPLILRQEFVVVFWTLIREQHPAWIREPRKFISVEPSALCGLYLL